MGTACFRDVRNRFENSYILWEIFCGFWDASCGLRLGAVLFVVTLFWVCFGDEDRFSLRVLLRRARTSFSEF